MLEIENSYYEDEVREGFFVPSIIKKAWAANLKVLMEVDRICKKHNIVYFAAYGTILGAIRHGRYIPWDDDLDIMMKREDYERFLSVAEAELQHGFTILNVKNTDNYWHFLSRVATGKHMRFEEDYLEEMHGFPYITGLDIFVLDHLSSDPQKESQRDTTINYILAVADQLENYAELQPESEEAIVKIESICDVKINRKQTLYRIRKDLYMVALSLCAKFQEDKEGRIARLMPDVLSYGAQGVEHSFFSDVVDMPFENISIPVPARYDELMRINYGDYFNVNKNCGGHDYPFFEKQKQQFEEVWGQKFPEYQYAPRDADSQKVISYKRYVQEYLCDMEQCILQYEQLDKLAEAQSLAIELGTFIDELKGEGTSSVTELEAFCENIFIVYNMLQEQQVVEETTINDRLTLQFNVVCTTIKKEIIQRKEVVFVCFSVKYWENMEQFYRTEISDEWNDVYVIPIPYYYKNYQGQIREEVFDISQYPKDVKILDYRTYDWEIRHPDKVYIQYPYDNWNSETTIPSEYFSENLWKYTEELIYVPYFILDEFCRSNLREYYNMKYYCTMPGVVNADKVILQSEGMKRVYIDKLVDFAGKDTEEIWQNKLCVSENIKAHLEEKSSKNKKTLLYYVGFSQLYQYGEQAIQKMNRVFDILCSNEDRLQFIIREDVMIEKNSHMLEKKVYMQYCEIIKKYSKRKSVTVISPKDSITDVEIVKMCDAYYGEASRLMNRFRRENKPIMVADVNV